MVDFLKKNSKFDQSIVPIFQEANKVIVVWYDNNNNNNKFKYSFCLYEAWENSNIDNLTLMNIIIYRETVFIKFTKNHREKRI